MSRWKGSTLRCGRAAGGRLANDACLHDEDMGEAYAEGRCLTIRPERASASSHTPPSCSSNDSMTTVCPVESIYFSG